MDQPRTVPVTLHASPNENGPQAVPGFIADTPENRAALEDAAIPKCREWREANREPLDPMCINDSHRYRGTCPAPYCCSAYCDRCAGLRALNGDDPALLPNEWMTK